LLKDILIAPKGKPVEDIPTVGSLYFSILPVQSVSIVSQAVVPMP